MFDLCRNFCISQNIQISTKSEQKRKLFFYSPPPPTEKIPQKGENFFRFAKFSLQSFVTFCDKKTLFCCHQKALISQKDTKTFSMKRNAYITVVSWTICVPSDQISSLSHNAYSSALKILT